jgi:hypothetical protein
MMTELCVTIGACRCKPTFPKPLTCMETKPTLEDLRAQFRHSINYSMRSRYLSGCGMASIGFNGTVPISTNRTVQRLICVGDATSTEYELGIIRLARPTHPSHSKPMNTAPDNLARAPNMQSRANAHPGPIPSANASSEGGCHSQI